MKIPCALPVIAILFSSCVSTVGIFQDGKTLGKDSLNFNFSLSYSPVPLYRISDTSFTAPTITNDRVAYPWVHVDVQYGLFNRMDVGAGVGTGLYSFGGNAFVKYALLPKEKKLGIAVMTQAASSFAPNVFVEKDTSPINTARYFVMTYAVPISFPIGKKLTGMLAPQYCTERLTLLPSNQSPKLNMWYQSVRLSTGLRFPLRKGKLDVTINSGYYASATQAFMNNLGFAYHLPVR